MSTIAPIEAPEQTAAPDEQPSRFALLKLLIGLAVVVALFVAFGLGALLAVIAAIVAMVMLHELGHFATAKWSGMKVTEYFVGFGPRLWSIRRGETEYGVKAIPAGGYVRIIGMTSAEEIHPDDEPRAYRNQPFGKRSICLTREVPRHACRYPSDFNDNTAGHLLPLLERINRPKYS